MIDASPRHIDPVIFRRSEPEFLERGRDGLACRGFDFKETLDLESKKIGHDVRWNRGAKLIHLSNIAVVETPAGGDPILSIGQLFLQGPEIPIGLESL